MAVSIDSRIWLATHLLYPNSSQAFDVYQTLASQSEASIKKNNVNYIFQKLYQIVEKIPAISSNKAFHVFDEDKIEQWKQIYKKSQKEQLIIFVGYFVFELKIKEIAGIVKLSPEKTQFLFHQVFKKTTFANIKIDVPEKVSFRKYNEEKVSFLFTNENLIDFALENLTPSEMKKIKLGLQLYPELQASQKQYDLIVAQMSYLIDSQVDRVTKTLIQTSEPLSEPRESYQLTRMFFENKKLTFAATFTAACLFIVVIRPNWLQSISNIKKDHFVDLLEIKPQQIPAELAADMPTDMPTDIPGQLMVEASNDQTKIVTAVGGAVMPTVKLTEVKVATATPAPAQPTPAAKSISVIKHEEAIAAEEKKSGGLYRGVLEVTDISEVSAKITQKLVDIGGKKAGEVELGWRKSNKLSYYHFTLPENNIEAMKEFLTKFGALQIQYESHPRLMPAGVKRLIIEVKERE